MMLQWLTRGVLCADCHTSKKQKLDAHSKKTKKGKPCLDHHCLWHGSKKDEKIEWKRKKANTSKGQHLSRNCVVPLFAGTGMGQWYWMPEKIFHSLDLLYNDLQLGDIFKTRQQFFNNERSAFNVGPFFYSHISLYNRFSCFTHAAVYIHFTWLIDHAQLV